MPSAQVGTSASGGGVSIQKSSVVTTDSASGLEVAIPVAWAVSSWVKTDADTAAGALTTGHGQATGTYDVYWTGGQRLGVAVTVSTDDLALEGGTGTDFPASADTTVVICEQLEFNAAIDGDELGLLAVSLEYTDASATSVGSADFMTAAPASLVQIDLNANDPLIYKGANATTTFTGAPVATVIASHSNTSAAATLKLIVMQDSTP